jgi:hypothetical protein
MAHGAKRSKIPPRPAAKIEYFSRRITAKMPKQCLYILRYIVLASAEPELIGSLIIMRERFLTDERQIFIMLCH